MSWLPMITHSKLAGHMSGAREPRHRNDAAETELDHFESRDFDRCRQVVHVSRPGGAWARVALAARCPAYSMASFGLLSLVMPLPAISKAMPGATGDANNRQPERDIDARKLLPMAGGGIDLEAERLDGNVSLVVIHRDHSVVLISA